MTYGRFLDTAAYCLAIIALGLASGCVDTNSDHSCQSPQNFCRSSSGIPEVDVSFLRFSGVEVGSEATETLTLRNTGDGSLRLVDIELIEEQGAGLDGHREFFLGARSVTGEPVTLEAEDVYEIPVRYRPSNHVGDRGTLILRFEGMSTRLLAVPIEALGLEPDIFSPRSISFGRVPPGDSETRVTFVQNVGEAPLVIGDIYIAESDRFRISYPRPGEGEDASSGDPANDLDHGPQVLAPGEQRPIRIWFAPDDNLPEAAELIFETNDPDQPQYLVELSANSGRPCIEVHQGNEVEFGSVPMDQTREMTVTVENCSRSEPLEIVEVELSDDGNGALTLERGNLFGLPVAIPPGVRATLRVRLEPLRLGPVSGELRIKSNDTASPELRVPISASVTSRCPVAKARARVVGSTQWHTTLQSIPLNTVEFDASQSFDPDGSIERTEWTILSRPQGSTQRMLPTSSATSPRLFLDRPGLYQVELKVYDDQNGANCGERAIITIDATGSGDVHVQLTWSTPADADPSDDTGTNLDLHYLHPQGHWNESPWDIFWQNPTADWGLQGTSADDPHLDIDRVNGLGPENINHSGLESRTYRIGVNYKSDGGLGASYATVRAYVRGSLVLEIQNKYLSREGKFWEVASIDWSNETVREIDQIYDGFPEP